MNHALENGSVLPAETKGIYIQELYILTAIVRRQWVHGGALLCQLAHNSTRMAERSCQWSQKKKTWF